MNLVSKITNGLAFYDLLDCPLTLVEMNRYLSSDEEEAENNPKVSLRQILVNLPSRAVFKNGFCFLNDDRGQVRQRIKREKSAAQKWRKLRRVGFFLQLIPFVRGVGVTGSMTLYNTRLESDFDLLIIA